jgi:hypothetical protein
MNKKTAQILMAIIYLLFAASAFAAIDGPQENATGNNRDDRIIPRDSPLEIIKSDPLEINPEIEPRSRSKSAEPNALPASGEPDSRAAAKEQPGFQFPIEVATVLICWKLCKRAYQ